LSGDRITHLHRINGVDGAGPVERLFSPRISPDGTRAIVLHDWGIGGKGTRDDVLIVDLDRNPPAITERVCQVADGLESLAFHPSGRFAVISCLEKGSDAITTSHLAVIDVTTRPARLLSYIPIEPFPEGIEFTPDGSKLFVGTTLANHIVVFDVDGFALLRSPFVLPTGYAPASLAIWAEDRTRD
jgi:DNA-binding beta-propeller fold protein YncE